MQKALIPIRFAAAAAILGSVAWQIADRAAHGLFRPGEYFSYFTIQAGLFTAAVLLYSGLNSLRGREETSRLTKARLAAAAASVVVAIVYNLLLRDTPPPAADAGYPWPATPNKILHVWAPAAVLLDWLTSGGARRLRALSAFSVTIFPLSWLGLSVVRGCIDGWWPYWFIDPSEKGGVAGMLAYIGGITVFFVVVGFLLVGAQRRPFKPGKNISTIP